MKVTKFMAMLLCGLTMCFGFASCDDDEDGAGDGPGSGSFNVEGFTSGKLSYAYLHERAIFMANYDWAKGSPKKAGLVQILIEFDEDVNSVPTGTFSCLVEGTKLIENKGLQSQHFQAQNADVTISKSGNGYSISVNGNASCDDESDDEYDEDYDDYVDDGCRSYNLKKFTLSYKGKVEKIK